MIMANTARRRTIPRELNNTQRQLRQLYIRQDQSFFFYIMSHVLSKLPCLSTFVLQFSFASFLNVSNFIGYIFVFPAKSQRHIYQMILWVKTLSWHGLCSRYAICSQSRIHIDPPSPNFSPKLINDACSNGKLRLC